MTFRMSLKWMTLMYFLFVMLCNLARGQSSRSYFEPGVAALAIVGSSDLQIDEDNTTLTEAEFSLLISKVGEQIGDFQRWLGCDKEGSAKCKTKDIVSISMG